MRIVEVVQNPAQDLATKWWAFRGLQEVFEGQLKHRGLLSMSSKSRYWELYVEEFDDLKAEPDEAFRRLFGEQFAGEYEKHLGVLKRSRSKPRR